MTDFKCQICVVVLYMDFLGVGWLVCFVVMVVFSPAVAETEAELSHRNPAPLTSLTYTAPG